MIHESFIYLFIYLVIHEFYNSKLLLIYGKANNGVYVDASKTMFLGVQGQ